MAANKSRLLRRVQRHARLATIFRAAQGWPSASSSPAVGGLPVVQGTLAPAGSAQLPVVLPSPFAPPSDFAGAAPDAVAAVQRSASTPQPPLPEAAPDALQRAIAAAQRPSGSTLGAPPNPVSDPVRDPYAPLSAATTSAPVQRQPAQPAPFAVQPPAPAPLQSAPGQAPQAPAATPPGAPPAAIQRDAAPQTAAPAPASQAWSESGDAEEEPTLEQDWGRLSSIMRKHDEAAASGQPTQVGPKIESPWLRQAYDRSREKLQRAGRPMRRTPAEETPSGPPPKRPAERPPTVYVGPGEAGKPVDVQALQRQVLQRHGTAPPTGMGEELAVQRSAAAEEAPRPPQADAGQAAQGGDAPRADETSHLRRRPAVRAPPT